MKVGCPTSRLFCEKWGFLTFTFEKDARIPMSRKGSETWGIPVFSFERARLQAPVVVLGARTKRPYYFFLAGQMF